MALGSSARERPNRSQQPQIRRLNTQTQFLLKLANSALYRSIFQFRCPVLSSHVAACPNHELLVKRVLWALFLSLQSQNMAAIVSNDNHWQGLDFVSSDSTASRTFELSVGGK